MDSSPRRLIHNSMLAITIVAVLGYAITQATHRAIEATVNESVTTTDEAARESRMSNAPANQTPRKANDFLDSIGLVTHLTYDSYKALNFDTVIKPRIIESGVRHIRDTTSTLDGCCGNMFIYSGKLKSLSASGVKTTVSTYYKVLSSNDANETPIYTADNQNRFVRKIRALMLGSSASEPSGTVNNTVVQGPSNISAFSSLNEPDHQPGLSDADWQSNFNAIYPTWPQLVVDYSRDLHTALKSDATTAILPIIAPSFVHLPVYPSNVRATLEGILPYVDKGNIHVYCHKKPPAQCLSTHFQPWQNFFGGKQIILTELGYHSVNGSGQATATSDTAIAKYLPQALATYFGLGVERVFIYELLDEGGYDRETSFGILRTDGSPKPAFHALKNLTTLLADSTSGFGVRSVDYSLSDASSTTHSLLLQKSDGSHYLLLWGEQGSDQVTITFAGQKSLEVYQPVDGISPTSSLTGSTININITDSITVLKFVPASSGSSAGSGGTLNNKTQKNAGGGSTTSQSDDEEKTNPDGGGQEGGGELGVGDDRIGLLPYASLAVSGWSSEARVAAFSALLLLLSFLFVWVFHHWRVDHWISGHILYRFKKLR